MTQDKGNDDLIGGLREAERARRNRVMIVGGLVAAIGILAFVLSVVFSDQLFQPKLDVQSGEKDVLADTNDPQCRDFIAQVTEIGERYQALEPQLGDQLLGDSPEAIEKLVAQIEALREELKAAKTVADAAELRFDNSSGEVNDWFRYTQNELHLLQKVGTQHIEALKMPKAPDAGTVVEEPAAKDEQKSTKTPQQRLEGATLATNEAFEKFRVWHTGGLHPCGKAAEGETPWSPAPATAANP